MEGWLAEGDGGYSREGAGPLQVVLSMKMWGTNFHSEGLCCKVLASESAELRSCVEVEVAVMGSPSLIVLIIMVSVDVKQL